MHWLPIDEYENIADEVCELGQLLFDPTHTIIQYFLHYFLCFSFRTFRSIFLQSCLDSFLGF